MQLKLDKILVPVDFSKVSIRALKYAILLAKKANASIELLHIVETYKMNVEMLDVDDIDELIAKKAEAKLHALVKENEDLKDVPLEVIVTKGKIKNQIVQRSREDDIDLIVMGTRGASGKNPISKYFLGSNAHRVIQAAQCPVLTVPSKKYKPVYENIVLPLDLEKETTLKTDVAIKWAKYFKSTVHLLSVFNFFEEYTVDVEDLKRELKEQAEKIVSFGVEVKVKSLRYAEVASAVIDYAEDNDADLIIIMTRQETKLDQLFLGSRAREVITKSKIPVLSLRPPLKEKKKKK